MRTDDSVILGSSSTAIGRLGSRPEAVAARLLAYCQANNWSGYDPYDALNSKIFRSLPLLDFKLPRLVLTQLLKRSPLNIRPAALIPRTQNPKGLALFLAALLKLSRLGLLAQEDNIEELVERLVVLRSPDTAYWCWGYSFPWQTRTIIVPRGAPNLVCTTFVADSLLDAYEERNDSRCFDMARSAAEYILNELYWTEGDSVASLSYPLASMRVQIHNANFLGAALLCRVYKHTREAKFLEPALRIARSSARRQQPDGSWFYGEEPNQRWIDNFHTGYNLGGLQSISVYGETREFQPYLQRGYRFYIERFFRHDGAPRYFHDRLYPIDVHCVAQSLITLLAFKDLDERSIPLANSVFDWVMRHMWDNRGYFYYRVLPFCTIKTSYMRWSQAWMLSALATFLEKGDAPVGLPSVPEERVMVRTSIKPDGAKSPRGTAGHAGYVLITPARNEAEFIERTIKSVISQTVKPARWVIVSDGSTDSTDDIANRYAADHDWIEVIRMPEHRDRHFAAKVSAFNAGFATLKDMSYGFIGALDADLSFDAEYFSFLLAKLAENPKLGLVGTPFAEDGVTYDYRFASVEHVSGACQLFRRECFEAIGGYVPMKSGGIDLVAVLASRMKGWQTRTFLEKTSQHHRKQGSATKSGLAVTFSAGQKDYLLGADPLWQVIRAAYRVRKPPYLLDGLSLLFGYLWPALLGRPKTAPGEIVAFRRQDQRARLRVLLRKLWVPGNSPSAR